MDSNKAVMLCVVWIRNGNMLNNCVFSQEELSIGNLLFRGTYRIQMNKNRERLLKRLAIYSELKLSHRWY